VPRQRRRSSVSITSAATHPRHLTAAAPNVLFGSQPRATGWYNHDMAEEPKDFVKTSVPLPAGHGWRCKPGNNLFVADRGAAAFEMPADWVIRHDGKQTLYIHDMPPPGDSCRIALTIFHLPPVKGGWGELPLAALLRDLSMMDQTRKKPAKRKKPYPSHLPEIHAEPRADLELVWADHGYAPDRENGQPIRTRQLLARARLVQVLITFHVYKQVETKFEPAWKDLLRSLRVAVPRDLTGGVGN
jgi:hypothetical protein